MMAVNKVQERHRAALHHAEAELAAVIAQLTQKQVVIDRYFTDYEDGKIDKTLLEERIEKHSVELTQLRRRRDEIQLLIDTAPEEITAD
jgi:hypothetical protein